MQTIQPATLRQRRTIRCLLSRLGEHIPVDLSGITLEEAETRIAYLRDVIEDREAKRVSPEALSGTEEAFQAQLRRNP